MNLVINNLEYYKFPISLFRQYLFCPRIVFFQEVIGLKAHMPSWTDQGNKHHKKQILLSKERTFKRFDLENGKMYFDIHLGSDLFNFHGICDAVIETEEEIVVLDFKLTEKVHKGHIFQLYAYALIAQEIFSKKSQFGFLLSGPKAKANLIEFTPELKKEFYNTHEEIKICISESTVPNSSASEAKCGQCEYFNFCNDRF